MKHLSLAALLVALVAPAARAQGTDNCTTPTVISGPGPHAFNTAGATTSPQQSGTCPTANRDVWFTWTAAASGSTTVSTCGGASFDTVVAVYAGTTCPAGGVLGCNDDSCGLQSNATFTATAGASYVIQIGAFGASTTGSGTFTVGAAPPAGCPGAVSGPDVIVGEIPDIMNVTAAGGLDGIAIGTTSCNMGDAPLSWVASTNQHPVIGMNLYRHKTVDGSGRFEQVGISWLKHGFTALSGSVCCTCSGGGGSQLSPGCSDPYSSGLNGNQGSLGPRWQVNADTGAFTYPPANPSYTSPQRLCAMVTADVESTSGTGIRYFTEGHYVAPDDAAAGHQNNNASWREATCNGTSFTLIGSTVRTQSAIRAWPLAEPGVTLTDVQADGLFVIGSQATSLGGGQYHYEFAVYNMNSDRNGGSFSVPIPAGATITNVGFHDVTYRAGDGPGNVAFSGTDWPATVGATSVSWATQTQAQNASANAIRWGSTYNFRFDANVAPTTGLVTLGLWKTGSPASMTATAEIPGGAPPFTSFCSGDGSGTACPCGNSGAAGHGCANSVDASGGMVTATGSPSITSDSMVLNGTNMPNSSALYFQGTSQAGGGAGTVFGDGLRCAGGSTIRLGTKINAGGASAYPDLGDTPISIRGANVPGNVRTYQIWYRNAAAFCTGDTFNLTNGVQTTWLP